MTTKPTAYQLKKYLPLFIFLTIFAIGVLIATLLSQQNQDIRQQASTPSGGAQIQINTLTYYPPGEQSIVQVGFNTGSYHIDGVQLVFTLSGTIPQDFTFTKDPSLTDFETIITTPSPSTYQIAFVTSDPNTPYTTSSSWYTLGTFTFTNPNSGTLNLTFNPDLTKITAHSESPFTVSGEDVLLTPNIYGTPNNYFFSFDSTSPSPSPSPSPIITQEVLTNFPIHVKIKGVASDVGPIYTTVNLGLMGDTTPGSNLNGPLNNLQVPLTHLQGDTYQGTISLNFDPQSFPSYSTGEAYWLTIKGEKHLQRAFFPITLSNDQVADLTSKPLEPGDLPDQDGQVDDLDLDRVFAIFAKPNQTIDDIHTGDVNYDGTVNAIDLGLILSTLSVKPDEAP